MPKRLELLRELLPTAKKFAALVNPANPNASTQLPELASAADALGIQLQILNARSADDIDVAFATIAAKQLGEL